MKSILFLLAGLVVLLNLPFLVSATNTVTFTWDTQTLGDLELRLWATRCMTSVGSQDLNVTVYRGSGSTVSTSANVTGTFYKPQGGSDTPTFTSQGDGNYLTTYPFSQNGTYKLVLHATDTNYTPGDLNEYVYVGDFDFNISFTNNYFSVNAGNTGTIQNRVLNSDGNRVTGLTGNIDLNYPDSSLFINDGTISETGNGDYYYNFTAPSTDGTYYANSFFTCGGNTDSNNQGRFTVSGSSTGSGSGSSGSGSGGSGGGGGGGGGSAWTLTTPFVLAPLGVETSVELGEGERIKFKLGNIDHYAGILHIEGDHVLVHVASTPQQTTLTLGKTARFELTGDNYYDLSLTLESYTEESAILVVKTIYEEVGAYEAQVVDWSFIQPLEVGEPNQLKITVKNTGYLGSAFLVIATITQVQKNEFIDTQLRSLIAPGESTDIYFDEPFTAFTSGSRILHVEIYKPDDNTKIGEFAQSFDVEGLLRYDIVATCLETSVVPGKEASALFNLINMGDYFQDMQFSWWAENESGQKIGLGTFPIALYNQEQRTLARSVRIPENAKPGEYQLKAQLAYKETVIEGACSFEVKTSKEYYEEQLSYAQTVFKELEQIAESKRGRFPPSVFERLNELRILLRLFENAIQNENYGSAEELYQTIRDFQEELSNKIIQEESPGLFDNVDWGQAIVTAGAVGLVSAVLLLSRTSAGPPASMNGSFAPLPDLFLSSIQRYPPHVQKYHPATGKARKGHTDLLAPPRAKPHRLLGTTPLSARPQVKKENPLDHVLGLKGIKD